MAGQILCRILGCDCRNAPQVLPGSDERDSIRQRRIRPAVEQGIFRVKNVFFRLGRWVGKATGRISTDASSAQEEPRVKPNLIERNQDSISQHLNRISARGESRHYVDNAVRDCIGEIAARERRQDLVPKPGEWLSNWRTRRDIPDEFSNLDRHLSEAFRARRSKLLQEKEQEEKEQLELACQKLIDRNQELIEKFLDIAERKVSIIDDYGDENWEALPDEILVCLRKIGEKEGLRVDWKQYMRGARKSSSFLFDPRVPAEYGILQAHLEKRFREFHESARYKRPDVAGVSNFSGEEFETHIAKLLRSRGYDVVGTPRTGDQGADLIAKKDGKTIVIQAKRYEAPVGNKAVQEVISAVSFYGGNEGWVVSNSTFTASAKALAQKANIRLVDGNSLQSL